MPSLRIRGLVRLANCVRREFSHTVSVGQREQLRKLVSDSLRQVDRILGQHATRLNDLPAPTRRAYQFLAGLNFDKPALQIPAPDAPPTSGNVSLVGLVSFWQHMLDRLAQPSVTEGPTKLHDSIHSASQNIERHLQNQDIGAGQLTLRSRVIRSWLLFFSERPNFDAYVAAVARATPILAAGLAAVPRFHPPLLVQFRPVPGLFRVRGGRDGTRVALPTPMITFDEQQFARVRELIFQGGRTKQQVVEAMSAEVYQDIVAELDALAGVPEQAKGLFHDLAAVYERVRQSYFDGTIGRPRLTWSRTFTGRKFGHYDRITDTVMISCSLDRADVPAVALDFVMCHELLHKKLGVKWGAGRMTAHTPEFRAAEQRFPRYAEADAILKKLARGQ
jgi:hypothetical protein